MKVNKKYKTINTEKTVLAQTLSSRGPKPKVLTKIQLSEHTHTHFCLCSLNCRLLIDIYVWAHVSYSTDIPTQLTSHQSWYGSLIHPSANQSNYSTHCCQLIIQVICLVQIPNICRFQFLQMLGFAGLSKHDKLHLSLSTHNPLCFGFISSVGALVCFLKMHSRERDTSLVRLTGFINSGISKRWLFGRKQFKDQFIRYNKDADKSR